ncbi:MAG: metal-dependent transcriptional regulator [Desulfobacterales bacterium]|nr:metal-dependent transcriptional regulator [Desulfobacterales bacterium]
MPKSLNLSESLEDYLEVILELQENKTVARSKDIAERLDIKRGSVTGMLKKLEKNGLINYEPYGFVTLTPEGKKIAKEIEKRHLFFKTFFLDILKLDEATAEKTACQMEHAMDQKTFSKFKTFIENASK